MVLPGGKAGQTHNRRKTGEDGTRMSTAEKSRQGETPEARP